MFRWFDIREPDEVRTLRPETTPPRPRNWTWRILFTVGLLVGLFLLVSLLPRLAHRDPAFAIDACDQADREVWSSVQHFEVMGPGVIDGVAGCSADRVTREPVEVIFDHYESALRAGGWMILDRTEPDPAATAPADPPTDGYGNLVQELVVGTLTATKDDYAITVAYDYSWSPTGSLESPGWHRRARFSVAIAPESPAGS